MSLDVYRVSESGAKSHENGISVTAEEVATRRLIVGVCLAAARIDEVTERAG